MTFSGFAHEEHAEVPAVLGVAPGTGAMFCSDACLEDWCDEQPEQRAGLERVRVSPPSGCCSFCWCCGSTVNVPECCVMHDGPCPVESFAATSLALEVCRELLERIPALQQVPGGVLDVAELLWGSTGMDSVGRLALTALWGWLECGDIPDESGGGR